MKKLAILTFIFLFQFNCFAQDSPPAHLKGKISYPAINVHMYSGVIDVEHDAMKYDASIDYKIVIDVYDKIQDSSKLHSPIREVARIFNLNVANGVPKEKLKMAAVVHYVGIDAILNDTAYEKKYGIKNPNVEAIKKLAELGVNFYVCGQNLGMYNMTNEELLPEIQVALSAKNAFITLDQRGYTYINVNRD